MSVDADMTSGSAEVELQRAILLYGDVHRSQRSAAATVHEITTDGKKQPALGLERAFTREMMQEIIDALAGEDRSSHQFLPAKVLCLDATLLAWHAPGQKRKIHFSTADKKFNAAVSGKRVAHPPLLFLAKPGRLHIFALQSDDRSEAKTPLMIAPYCDLYEGGAMCTGTVKLPGRCSIDDIPKWEEAFYDSTFTHSNLTSKMTSFPGGHHALWQAMTKQAVKAFPIEHLLPARLTLTEALNK